MAIKLPAPVPQIPVSDLERAISFYQSRLGFALDWKHDCEIVLASAEGRRVQLARLKEIRAARECPLESLPLVVLMRDTDSTPAMVEVHAALAKLSKNSRHTVVPGAGHEIHLFEPYAVIEAITDVIDAVRHSNQPLPVR